MRLAAWLLCPACGANAALALGPDGLTVAATVFAVAADAGEMGDLTQTSLGTCVACGADGTVIDRVRSRVIAAGWVGTLDHADGLEIHPCREVQVGTDGDTAIEQCDPGEAAFWTVYGHRVTGGLEALLDFGEHRTAEAFAALLRRTWPHLDRGD